MPVHSCFGPLKTSNVKARCRLQTDCPHAWPLLPAFKSRVNPIRTSPEAKEQQATSSTTGNHTGLNTATKTPRFIETGPNDSGRGQISTSENDVEDGGGDGVPYQSLSIWNIVSTRSRWLALFCCGLIATAFVLQSFEDIIETHVALSFFVPLVMGHGGNTGSQTVSNLIRALALEQVKWKDVVKVVAVEAASGGLIGAILGGGVLILANIWPQISGEVGVVVAMSMPVVSFWSNGIAALITLAAHKAKLDPTMTAGPLTATVVDTSGLVIYLAIARAFISGMDANID